MIDVHSHWMPQELVADLPAFLPDGYSVQHVDDDTRYIVDPTGLRVQTVSGEDFPDLERRVARMDEAGIDIAFLSPGCTPSFLTMKAARFLNDASTDVMRTYGDRLKPMINLPPFGDPDVLDEMKRAARLGLTGVAMTTNFGGLYPDEEVYRPFFKQAAELGQPVFLHAAAAPVQNDDLLRYGLVSSLGRSLDICLALLRIIASGVMEDLPELKLIVAHLGGFTFLNQKRFFVDPDLQTRGYKVPLERAQKVMERMLFDTAPPFWYAPADIDFAVRALGVERIALGSDYPHGSMSAAVAHVSHLDLEDQPRDAILRANTARFFDLTLKDESHQDERSDDSALPTGRQ